MSKSPFDNLTEAMSELNSKLHGVFGVVNEPSKSNKIKLAVLKVLNAVISFMRDTLVLAVIFLICLIVGEAIILFFKSGPYLTIDDIFNIMLLGGAGVLFGMIYKSL